ncbi:hypothetical protein [Paraliobacillus zengyii]|uniref:hypothetical protein n=1 Tax=Paraliobacillus zengyii TaxID=2213194 RepID=UPI000DD2D920|nr:MULTISPECIES: hypothetical protein [Paraliobacillus]
MSRFYRFRLPPWCQQWLLIIERCMMPILIVQCVRTLFFPTTFDVLLLGVFMGIYISFYFKWI